MTDGPMCTPAQEAMQSFPARSVEDPICPCQQGNLFYQHNMSSTALSTIFAPNNGGMSTPVLAQFTEEPLNFANVVDTSGGNLEASINGQAITILENIDTSQLNTPEDLRAGIVVGAPRTTPREPLSLPQDGIPFQSEINPADFAKFLPDGVSESNTDIDMVCVLLAAPGTGALSEGQYNVDDVQESALRWLLVSLAQNTFANVTNEAAMTGYYLNGVRQAQGVEAMRSVLKEVILQGRFTIKRISSFLTIMPKLVRA